MQKEKLFKINIEHGFSVFVIVNFQTLLIYFIHIGTYIFKITRFKQVNVKNDYLICSLRYFGKLYVSICLRYFILFKIMYPTNNLYRRYLKSVSIFTSRQGDNLCFVFSVYFLEEN